MGQALIADDHPLFRGALRAMLDMDALGLDGVRECGDFDAVLDAVKDDVEVVLLDLSMPGSRGIAGLLTLRARYPDVPVVVVSASDDAATVEQVMAAGASGFVPKSAPPETIRAALRAVLAGEIWRPDASLVQETEADATARAVAQLTPQQSRVLAMVADGLLNKQIAHELGVSEATVKAHVSAVLSKLGVDSRTQAALVVTQLGAPTS